MKKQKLRPALPVWGVLLIALILGVAELGLWLLCGYAPLLALALLQLMGAAVNLPLLLPLGKSFTPLAPLVTSDGKKHLFKKLFHGLYRLLRKIATLWHTKWTVIASALIIGLIFAANWFFWPNLNKSSDPAKLAYYQPVVLAALFVVSIIAEKWCSHLTANDACPPRQKAIISNLRGSLMISRIGQLVTAAAMVISLIGLYDGQTILQYVLLALFLYATALLLLSLGIRIVRKELTEAPYLPLSAKAAGASNLLAYLEENTGITMRSLWSIRLIRQLLPGVMLFVVLLTWLSTGIVQVDSHQEGALYRLGKLTSKPLQPGLHMTLPWPFDKVELHDTQSVRKIVVGYVPNGTQDNTWTDGHGTEEYRLLLGGGKEIVSINLQVEYRITDLNHYLQSSASAESLLSAAAYEIVTARTIVTDIETLLSADRTLFSKTFQEELSQRIARYDVGIEVANVDLESIHPPVEVATTYQKAISAGIQAEQLILEAERQAILKTSAAFQEAYAKKSLSSTSQKQAIANAKGEVSQFLASVQAYQAYPSAYVYYKYITAITQAYDKGVLIVVGDGIDSGNLIIGDLSRPVAVDPYFLEPEVEEEYFE